MSNIYKEAIDVWGESHQVDMMIEEMSELTQSLLKMRRYVKENVVSEEEKSRLYNHICEEIADVENVIRQMRELYSPEIIERYKKEKLIRLRKRIIKKQGRVSP